MHVTGGTGNNVITGKTSADTLDGGLGKDILTGGAGKDTFFFSTNPSGANLDHIKDFKPVDDTIKLENDIFKALTHAGTLRQDQFAVITSKSQSVDTDVHILYYKAHGALYHDSNGGTPAGRVEIAILDNHPTLTFHDFLVA